MAPVARVDGDDDSIKRYVVRLHAFDHTRHERRHQEVAAFDNEAEAMECFGTTHLDLVERRKAGRADAAEPVTMVVMEPGSAERNKTERTERRVALRRLGTTRSKTSGSSSGP
jgi:hypothetical protein